MGGAAHGFIRPPLRLAAEMATTAASAGGPAGPPPWLHARRRRLRPRRDQRASNEMRRWLAVGDTIIDDHWTVGDNKEGSGQEQTTTNHCVLKAGKRRPAERAVGNEKGKDNANEEDEQRGGGLPQQQGRRLRCCLHRCCCYRTPPQAAAPCCRQVRTYAVLHVLVGVNFRNNGVWPKMAWCKPVIGHGNGIHYR